MTTTKLYKRCARKHHAACPGSFETWSVCNCECHIPTQIAEYKAEVVKARRCLCPAGCHAAICNCECHKVSYTKPPKPKAERRVAGPRNAKGGLKCSPRIGAMSEGKGHVNGGYIKISAEDRATNLLTRKGMATTLMQDIAEINRLAEEKRENLRTRRIAGAVNQEVAAS